ncbi:hypothetical protein HH303_10270 [Rhodospirillaceae bacterium KN72]|uniref:Uncharacterized protein n=1 Tax=Pacificispira spongiicola TaxID=2729598 RepID=A0A7Y0E099_9PROT|nr:hypothetical protein [Pacificispira spongiicola]NMM44862.1 hypothetical protein [Pacificispira spongiicola]
MHFRLTYAGQLLASRNDKTQSKRSLHKHDIRKSFHKQLKCLWSEHPVLSRGHTSAPVIGSTSMKSEIDSLGFRWKPIVTEKNGLICALDILLLRHGAPGRTIQDIDNRVKTIFDALCMPRSPEALGAALPEGPRTPDADESPFYVLLEDDSLITHLSVTSDILLEPVEGVPADQSARLVISVTVRPYNVTQDNLDFS